jgi:hypothetical protein
MKALRRAACALLVAISLIATPALPTAFSVDQSDIYYIAGESGWGIQLVQRGSIIFATIFIYGPTGAPTWYVATMNSTDGVTWTGDLLATTGDYFATVPFNPANVKATKVGTMTWVPTSATAGTLTYVVNGTTIVKQVTRQSLALDNFGGTYLSAMHLSATGCTNPTDNTPPTDVPFVTITITQNGQSGTVSISIFGLVITIVGTFSQDGQFGSLTGTYAANVGGEIGNASVSQINVQANSLSASFSLQSTNIGCLDTGYFAGMRQKS